LEKGVLKLGGEGRKGEGGQIRSGVQGGGEVGTGRLAGPAAARREGNEGQGSVKNLSRNLGGGRG